MDLDRIRLDYWNFGVTVVRQALSEKAKSGIETGLARLREYIDAGTMKRSARFVLGSATQPSEIYDLYKEPLFVQIATTVLGTPNICLYMNRILLKDGDWDGSVAVHQDAPYFSGSLEKMTIYVPLRATGPSRGGLIFVKGSHKYGGLPRGTINRDAFEKMDDVAPDLEVGDVVVMDHLTWHYSEKSTEPIERPLLQISYQSAADGSYATLDGGVAKPTLVTGTWQTRFFAPFSGSVTPDS